jgi:hypothetical protein
MLKRKMDIEELLSTVSNNLCQINNIYSAAAKNEDIIQVERPLVKTCLEHLRSTLDYVAADLSEITNSPKKPKNVYFPYGEDKSVFLKSLDKNLPDLSDLYKVIIERYQPHASGNNWLLHLCKTTNINKHINLQEQNRKNSDSSVTTVGNVLTVKGGGRLEIGNFYINGEHKNPKGSLVITPDKKVKDIIKETGLDIPIDREYESVKFELKDTIKDTNFDVRELLNTAHKKIKEMTSEIYSA